jgi:hypothetical protein
MKLTTFLTLCIAALLICGSAGSTDAQSLPSIESMSQSHFKQMSFDDKKALFYSWVNKSGSINIPSEYEKRAQDYYLAALRDDHGYRKHLVFFRVLFNESLHVIDRINFCSFLLDNFSDEYIPLSLIRETKDSLVRSTLK